MTTGGYGSEVSWTLGTTCSNDQRYNNTREVQYNQTCYLTPGIHTLICHDGAGDGWEGGFLEIDGIKYCENFTRFNETVQVTVAGEGTDMNLHIAICLSIMSRIIMPVTLSFIFFYNIDAADPCVDYCHNYGNCTLTYDKENEIYKPMCECAPTYAGFQCEIPISKCYLL